MFFLRACIALGCVLAFAGPSSAQQTVDVAASAAASSTRPGAVIPGATVTATQVRDQRHRHRHHRSEWPVSLSVPPHRRLRHRGQRCRVSRTCTRRLDARASARRYELPVHARRSPDSRRRSTSSAETPVLEAARSQIAATVRRGGSGGAADERPQLPRPGAARARRGAGQHRQHAAVSRNLGGARHHAFRSAANATCRTTSSSTASRPMTMRRG